MVGGPERTLAAAACDDDGVGDRKQRMRRPIANNSRPGQAIYDPFLGSGTTLIAAEMTGRSGHWPPSLRMTSTGLGWRSAGYRPSFGIIRSRS
jgi:hypothetical protein